MQGESDATGSRAALYYKNLEKLHNGIKKAYLNPKLKLIIGRIADDFPKKDQHWEIVRNAQVTYSKRNSFVSWIDTDGFSMDSDLLHYDNNGTLELGRAYVTSILESSFHEQ